MPRPLVFGNGSFLVGIDEHYTIRDLFWPKVGMYNHLSGHPIRFGVWVDGHFSWTHDADWSRSLDYANAVLVGESVLENAALAIRLKCSESVHPHEPVFVRRIEVTNLGGSQREVRLFFSHDLRLCETDIGDTAFYDPFIDSLVHYKGSTYLAFSAWTAHAGLDQYTTGIKEFNGHPGTWQDAHDGVLEPNPISQGSVDSTLGARLTVGAGDTAHAHYAILAAASLSKVEKRHHWLVAKGFDHAIEESRRYWSAWSKHKAPGLSRMPEAVQRLFRLSVQIIRTQIDDGGAILAANDSDIMKTNRANYCYMWPRDGALVAMVLDRLGYESIGRRFFEFCMPLIEPDRPFFLHKYGPDGSVGASWHPWIVDGRPEVPFQEDETALTVVAIAEHARHHRDVEFVSDLYQRIVLPASEFMLAHRDQTTRLPLPSWDLWEERRGVHTNTVAAVEAAFRAGAWLSEFLGMDGARFKAAAEETRVALLEHLYDSQRGVFFRCLKPVGDGWEPDQTVDSSILAVGLLGCLPPDHAAVVSTCRVVEEQLAVRTGSGGLARYEGDYYFRQIEDAPGNPWVISTLWLAQSLIRAAKTEADLAQPLELILWAVARAETTGVLAEQFHPVSGGPLSVSPLTWSHAEFVQTVLDYAAKLGELG